MELQKLKRRILYAMLISKFLVIAALIFFMSTPGGYGLEEGLTVATFILPLFTVYLGVIMDDTLANPFDEKTGKKKQLTVKKEIAGLSAVIFPVYTIAILIALYLGAIRIFEVKFMVGIIESGLGFYVGKIIVALFKAKQG